MIKDIILEGMDRTGKSSHAANLWTTFNSMPVNHGASIIRGDKMQSKYVHPSDQDHYRAYSNYQNHSFKRIKHCNDNNIEGVRIYDRFHLSECVYGTKYRKYDGSYVFDIEANYIKDVPEDNIILITFIDSVDSLLSRDDGDGFTSDPKEIHKEIDLFVDAHYDSNIINKHIINISDYDCDIDKVYEHILTIVLS
jgi:thymidylate kinase